jgi:hypothetical protein
VSPGHSDEARMTAWPQRPRSNFSPIQEVGCTAFFRVSDTRCGTYVIYAAYFEGRCSIQLSYGRVV